MYELWHEAYSFVRKSSAVFQLLASEDETLLIRRNTLLVLNLGLYIVNAVGRFDFKGDSLASKSFDKDLHASSQSQHQVKSRFLLDVVIRESSTVLKLLSGKDETLLVRRDTFFVLNL